MEITMIVVMMKDGVGVGWFRMAHWSTLTHQHTAAHWQSPGHKVATRQLPALSLLLLTDSTPGLQNVTDVADVSEPTAALVVLVLLSMLMMVAKLMRRGRVCTDRY